MYGLVSFYYATQGDSWNNCNSLKGHNSHENDICIVDGNQCYRWLSNVTECLWCGVTCDENKRVVSVVLGECLRPLSINNCKSHRIFKIKMD